jgi:hypothetical protein
MPDLIPINCARHQVLMDADSSLETVFFPDSGVISIVAVYANGDIIEMATIGREGCSGAQAAHSATIDGSHERKRDDTTGRASPNDRKARADGLATTFRLLQTEPG